MYDPLAINKYIIILYCKIFHCYTSHYKKKKFGYSRWVQSWEEKNEIIKLGCIYGNKAIDKIKCAFCVIQSQSQKLAFLTFILLIVQTIYRHIHWVNFYIKIKRSFITNCNLIAATERASFYKTRGM